MNKLLEEAIVSVERLSERDQELAAKFLLGFANPDAHHYQLSDQQLAEVELAKCARAKSQATPKWKKCGDGSIDKTEI
jgi:hypothetical protein